MARPPHTRAHDSAMRRSLFAKLFAAVLAACTLVLVAQALMWRYNLQDGLIGYLEQDAADSLDRAAPVLERAYAEHGDWTFLDRSPEAWITTMRPAFLPNGGAMSSADQLGAPVRIGLFDAQMRHVAGNRLADPRALRRALRVDARVVGWVAMVPLEDALAPGLQRFIERQRELALVSLVFSLATVAVVTFLLTRPLHRRLRELGDGTRAMARGEYATRIDTGVPDELGALARDFNHMAQALEFNERARRDFLVDISHELRTPLAVIRAEVEAMQDGVRRPNADPVDNIARNTRSLNALIDDLHDLALTDVGAMAYRFGTVDMRALAADAAASLAPRFAERELAFDADIGEVPLPVHGDPLRLRQLLDNLLANSLRYTDAGGRVSLRCAAAYDALVLVVEDGAPGVDAAHLPRLFDRFYRAEGSRNRATGGSGLGLAICRNIVEAHGGRIGAAASAAGGLQVTVSLPLEAR